MHLFQESLAQPHSAAPWPQLPQDPGTRPTQHPVTGGANLSETGLREICVIASIGPARAKALVCHRGSKVRMEPTRWDFVTGESRARAREAEPLVSRIVKRDPGAAGATPGQVEGRTTGRSRGARPIYSGHP